MSDHFAAFSFVDRITALEPGLRARGTFAIPPHIDAFPSCLMAEAVGQLAAWVAMAHIRFRGRPVAALALETRFLHLAPGQATAILTSRSKPVTTSGRQWRHRERDGSTRDRTETMPGTHDAGGGLRRS
jgi:hypothetical protein